MQKEKKVSTAEEEISNCNKKKSDGTGASKIIAERDKESDVAEKESVESAAK